MHANSRLVRLVAVAALMFSIATMSPSAFAEDLVQSCKGLQVGLTSLDRTGPGDVTAQFFLQNQNNDDMAIFVYYGGSNGKNTFLIDDSGSEWPKKRMDGNGNHRQAVMAGVKTKYSLVFHKASGGQEAKSFQVIVWAQLLPLTGMGETGWCKYQFSNVSLSQ